MIHNASKRNSNQPFLFLISSPNLTKISEVGERYLKSSKNCSISYLLLEIFECIIRPDNYFTKTTESTAVSKNCFSTVTLQVSSIVPAGCWTSLRWHTDVVYCRILNNFFAVIKMPSKHSCFLTFSTTKRTY